MIDLLCKFCQHPDYVHNGLMPSGAQAYCTTCFYQDPFKICTSFDGDNLRFLEEIEREQSTV
jgi:hypothetical protein